MALKGQHGTSCLLDCVGRKQNVVAASLGVAKTAALSDALQTVIVFNRGHCAAALPAVDVLGQLLGRRAELTVLVDATVGKRAAEKGVSKHVARWLLGGLVVVLKVICRSWRPSCGR